MVMRLPLISAFLRFCLFSFYFNSVSRYSHVRLVVILSIRLVFTHLFVCLFVYLFLIAVLVEQNPVETWFLRSSGFKSYGQKEIAFTLKKRTNEETSPYELLKVYRTLYSMTLNEGERTSIKNLFKKKKSTTLKEHSPFGRPYSSTFVHVYIMGCECLDIVCTVLVVPLASFRKCR